MLWNYWKKSYINVAESTYELTEYLDTVDAFYATIEKITDTEMYDNSKILNVKGLESNSQKYREQYEIDVHASTVKIMWNGTEVKTTDFKVGQTILIISFLFFLFIYISFWLSNNNLNTENIKQKHNIINIILFITFFIYIPLK